MKVFSLIFSLLLAISAKASVKSDLLFAVESIQEIINTKYLLLEIKQRQRGWNPASQLTQLHDQIASTPDALLDPVATRTSLARVLRSAGDLHLRPSIISSERSTLPFQLRSTIDAQKAKHYQVSWTDPSSTLNLKWGDEIISMNGRSPDDLVTELALTPIIPVNTRRSVEALLTERFGYRGDDLPQGDVLLQVKRFGQTDVFEVLAHWNYKGDLVGFPGTRKPLTPAPLFDPPVRSSNLWAMGGRDSYLLPLGTEVSSSRPDEFFKASIQKVGTKQIGVIRIPSFSPSNLDQVLAQFATWIATFEAQTSFLVIDVLNNPGGNIAFAHATLSYLVNTPIEACRAWRSVDFDDVTRANNILLATERVTDDRSAEAAMRSLYGISFSGMPLDFNLAQAQRAEAQGIFAAWEKGSRSTEPVPIQGAEKIFPRTAVGSSGAVPVRYSKPIVVVVNGNSMSAAETFASILQDAQRAKIFGEQTPGAGASQRDLSFPNRIGFDKIRLSDSILLRPNGQLIEDHGIMPDYTADLSPSDLINGYTNYRSELIKIVTQ